MGDILGYASSTGDQDCTGQELRPETTGAIRVFEDVRSGGGSGRPGLRKLLARHGDTLAVVRVDRLGRSLAELLGLQEGLDSGSARGELVFQLFGATAHFERRAAGAKGKRLGRPAVDRGKAAAALKLVQPGLSSTAGARRVGLGRATVYCEMAHVGARRSA